MKKNTRRLWLILDCNYLCHRSARIFFSLSHQDEATGISYGFLKDLQFFKSHFQTDDVIFCWDCSRKINLRRKIDPQYKASRDALVSKKEKSTEDEYLEEMKENVVVSMKKQTILLRKEYLPTMGYKNVFYKKGYESDDLIASVCKSIPAEDEAIIISADQDLYQLITDRIYIYNPQKRDLVTKKEFKRRYGINPEDWVWVKVLSGCKSDNVKGIAGIGEMTAIKYIRGELKKTYAKYKKIKENKKRMWKRNSVLVKLPFRGTPVFKLEQDKISRIGHQDVFRRLGIRSLNSDVGSRKNDKKRKEEEKEERKREYQGLLF